MRPWRLLAATSILLSAFAIFVGVVLYVRVADQQDRQAETTRKLCVVQGVNFAGVLANLGLALETANNLQHARDPKIAAFYTALAPALRTTLDNTFKHPPRCGEKFTFTIQVTGEKRRHVETPGSP
jgi:hypothetical protein